MESQEKMSLSTKHFWSFTGTPLTLLTHLRQAWQLQWRFWLKRSVNLVKWVLETWLCSTSRTETFSAAVFKVLKQLLQLSRRTLRTCFTLNLLKPHYKTSPDSPSKRRWISFFWVNCSLKIFNSIKHSFLHLCLGAQTGGKPTPHVALSLQNLATSVVL